MSCCRVILVVVSALITPPWLASVVKNFERGDGGAS